MISSQVTTAFFKSDRIQLLHKFQSSAARVVRAILKMAAFLIQWIKRPSNWQLKRTWIGALVFLRAAYVLMNEYGRNPFKKSLAGNHVFLSGAGSGIGRLMAVRFGLMGCKLSLGDVNTAGLEETKQICIKNGVNAERICTFFCDVSRRESVREAAVIAR